MCASAAGADRRHRGAQPPVGHDGEDAGVPAAVVRGQHPLAALVDRRCAGPLPPLLTSFSGSARPVWRLIEKRLRRAWRHLVEGVQELAAGMEGHVVRARTGRWPCPAASAPRSAGSARGCGGVAAVGVGADVDERSCRAPAACRPPRPGWRRRPSGAAPGAVGGAGAAGARRRRCRPRRRRRRRRPCRRNRHRCRLLPPGAGGGAAGAEGALPPRPPVPPAPDWPPVPPARGCRCRCSTEQPRVMQEQEGQSAHRFCLREPGQSSVVEAYKSRHALHRLRIGAKRSLPLCAGHR